MNILSANKSTYKDHNGRLCKPGELISCTNCLDFTHCDFNRNVQVRATIMVRPN